MRKRRPITWRSGARTMWKAESGSKGRANCKKIPWDVAGIEMETDEDLPKVTTIILGKTRRFCSSRDFASTEEDEV